MSDNLILYPIIKKSDFLHTEMKLSPNEITLINNLIISPILLYFLYSNNTKISFILLYLRSYLDGVDGYIARKYNKGSKLGEIYDHVSDSIYSGFITLYCLNQISSHHKINYSISYVVSIIIMMINFDKKLKYIGEKIMGAGGKENTYSTLINFIPLLLINKNINKIKIGLFQNLKNIYKQKKLILE